LWAELAVLEEWLEENMWKAMIRQLSSPFVAPVLFATKPEGGHQSWIVNWDANSKTVQNQYTHSLI